MNPQNPATDSNEILPEADYDEILSKLDALLRRYQGKPPSAAEADNMAAAPLFAPGAATGHRLPTAGDDIPTLTETVLLHPSMLSSQPDLTSLLEQILDSALKDAGLDLDARARIALVQALEHRLFGL